MHVVLLIGRRKGETVDIPYHVAEVMLRDGRAKKPGQTSNSPRRRRSTTKKTTKRKTRKKAASE